MRGVRAPPGRIGENLRLGGAVVEVPVTNRTRGAAAVERRAVDRRDSRIDRRGYEACIGGAEPFASVIAVAGRAATGRERARKHEARAQKCALKRVTLSHEYLLVSGGEQLASPQAVPKTVRTRDSAKLSLVTSKNDQSERDPFPNRSTGSRNRERSDLSQTTALDVPPGSCRTNARATRARSGHVSRELARHGTNLHARGAASRKQGRAGERLELTRSRSRRSRGSSIAERTRTKERGPRRERGPVVTTRCAWGAPKLVAASGAKLEVGAAGAFAMRVTERATSSPAFRSTLINADSKSSRKRRMLCGPGSTKTSAGVGPNVTPFHSTRAPGGVVTRCTRARRTGNHGPLRQGARWGGRRGGSGRDARMRRATEE